MTIEQMILSHCVRDFMKLSQVECHEDFFKDADLKFFEMLVDLKSKGQHVDCASIHQLSASYINASCSQVFTEISDKATEIKDGAAGNEEFEKLISDCIRKKIDYQLRGLLACKNIATDEFLSTVRNKLDEAESLKESENFKLYNTIDTFTSALTTNEKFIESGYNWIDENIGGWPSAYIVLAARPSVGKTTMGLNILMKQLNAGNQVLFFSAEMSVYQVGCNIISMLSGVEAQKIRKRLLSKVEELKIKMKLEQFARKHIDIIDEPNIDIKRLVKIVLRLNEKNKYNMMLIDYLQLLGCKGQDKKPRHEQVAYISRELKGLQRKLDIPLIACAQLNREADGKETRPKLSNLKDSGAIEQDADIVAFLHDASTENNPGIIEEIFAKNRNGMTGIVKYRFNKPCLQFIEITNKAQLYNNEE